jgi:hypothetical protein
MMHATLDAATITVCKPGKRSAIVHRQPQALRFPITTVVAMRAAKSERQIAAERIRGDAEERETMSVVLAQKHRDGRRSSIRGYALGRFVDDHCLRGALHQAGMEYAETVREDRLSLGLPVPGQPWGPGGNSELSGAEVAARRELASMARTSADKALHNRQRIDAMLRLTYDDLDPPASETRMLKSGLYALARHFGLLNLGINEGKPA